MTVLRLPNDKYAFEAFPEPLNYVSTDEKFV